MLAAMVERGTPLRATDLVAGVPVAVLAVVATASLAWAHLGHHSLAAVLLTSAVVLGGIAFALRRTRVEGDRNGLLAMLACGVLAAVMFFPGFPYGVGDKDPGNYVAHAVQIARGGSYDFTDPALAHPNLPVRLENEKARHPAMWVDDRDTGRIVPQFFHLWPALLATAYDIGGYGGMVGLAPLIGVVAVLGLVALLRRVGGVVAGTIGGVLLATNMLQVWQAKYPSTEVFAQALYVGALLAVVVAAQERWHPAAAFAGAFVGVGFLNRADGWLLLMLAAGTLGALWVTRRADGEVAWGAAGLAVVLPYGLWQAYDAAVKYTMDNGVPGLRKTVALLAVVAVGAAVARVGLRPAVDAVARAAAEERVQRRAGLALCAVVFVLLVVGFLRPLFGEVFIDVHGKPMRSYDEINLHRLAWFLGLPAFALAGLGVATVALRRWRTASWAVVLPTLALTVLYSYHARVASRLMWWGRRYVSNVLPGLVALVALALAYAFFWQWRGRRPLRLPAIGATALLTAFYLWQSVPLRSHAEFAGSFGVAERVSALSGDARGVYLWHRGPCCASPGMLWPGPVWLERGELSVLLPSEDKELAAYVKRYREEFDPVFVVWDGTTLPKGLQGLGLQAVDHIEGEMPFWEEHDIERPRRARVVEYDFTVYRVP